MNTFVQDDYKISSRLTFDLGVRWEYDGDFNDKYGSLTNVWPNLISSTAPPTGPPAPGTNGPASGYIGYVVPNNYVSHYGPPGRRNDQRQGYSHLGHRSSEQFRAAARVRLAAHR